MTPVTTFKGKRAAIFGLGASGLSAARALIAGGFGIGTAAWAAASESEARMNAASRRRWCIGQLRGRWDKPGF